MLTVLLPAQKSNQHDACRSDAPAPVELHGCRAVTAGTAGLVRQLCERDREVLPRWHQEDRGWRDRHRGHHEAAPPGAYAGIRPWSGRDHWLSAAVPLAWALARQEGHLGAHLPYVARDTFLAWARVESRYAQDQRTGRRLVVRPDTVAGVLDVDTRTVQRCRQLARALGLLVDVVRGRMLTVHECLAARRRGSRQRGLSNESALTIPDPLGAALRRVSPGGHRCGRWRRRLVDSVTPTRGSSGEPKTSPETCGTDSCAAESEAAPPPPRPRRRRRRPPPAVLLAQNIAASVPWLAGERLSALIPTLHRLAACEPAWTAQDVIDLIDATNRRLGYTAARAEAIRTTPAALLAWYLRDVDAQVDHPRFEAFVTGTAIEQRAPWCGRCEPDTRQVWHPELLVASRCPSCHPLANPHR